MFNWPIADNYIKDRKELIQPWTVWKLRYHKLFPDDNMLYMQRAKPDDYEWYKLPVERFLIRMQEHVDEGMDEGDAFDLALQEKKWDEEAKDIEARVQKHQLEYFFGVPEYDWIDHFTKGNANTQYIEDDPRRKEEEHRELNMRIMNLIHQRTENPNRRKIRLADTKAGFEEFMDWFYKHPEFRDHFDESVYWGEIPMDRIPKSLPADMRDKGIEARQDDNTLLEDLDHQMSDWAQDLLSHYWEKVDLENPELSEKDKVRLSKDGMAAAAARSNLVGDTESWVETRMRQYYSDNPDKVPAPNTVFSDGAHEVVKKSIEEKPFISTKLEKELSDLFSKVGGKD